MGSFDSFKQAPKEPQSPASSVTELTKKLVEAPHMHDVERMHLSMKIA